MHKPIKGQNHYQKSSEYIEDVLPERTYQKWGYEQVPQSHITGTGFPIGVK